MSSLDPVPTEAADPSVVFAEQRLMMLRELAEIGMDLARALRRKAVAEAELAEAAAASGKQPPASPAGGKDTDPADSFAKLSRAVRLTLTLEARTDEALRALRAGVVVEVKARRAEAVRQTEAKAQQRRADHRTKVRDLVLDVAEREIGDPDEFENLQGALYERFENDPAYQNLEALPLREVVEQLCNDLGLHPDWSRWCGDDWAPPPGFFRPKYSDYSTPSRRPSHRNCEDEPSPARLE